MSCVDLDCLFVHAPKADAHYLPIGDFFNITYMPMGLMALANELRRRQLRTEVVHLGVEWLVEPTFNVVRAFDGQRIRAIGLPLYWHYQSFDVIEVARALKVAHPEAFVFLGGLTAGYFARELLERYAFLDGVVRGHAEGSCPRLIEELGAAEPDLGLVHGLVYRSPDGRVVDTTGTTRAHAATPVPPLDDLVFGDLTALRHADVYASQFGFPLAYGREWSRTDNRASLSMGRAFYPLFIGRGCAWTCTFCGGNRDTLRQVNSTSKLQWRSPAAVVEDIRRAMDFGYRTMAVCFDPTPDKDTYWLDLFERIETARLGCDLYFECWGLPTERFVQRFRRTFPSPESYLAISPDAGDEAVRKVNKQPFYTDRALFQSLDVLRQNDVSADVFYTIALPTETVHTARATQRQIDHSAATYPNARRLMTWSVQLEPGSPQFERPADFGMVTDRSCFDDFYRVHGGLGRGTGDTYSSLGFKIAGYFGDERDQGGIAEFERHLQHLKCMEFCFLGKDPRFRNDPARGRAHCFDRQTALAERRGIAPPTRPIGDGFDYTDALADEQARRGAQPRFSWV